jgi:DMSO/TMAO reductase YedYZ molybdopterin-dependent catalytic subunit
VATVRHRIGPVLAAVLVVVGGVGAACAAAEDPAPAPAPSVIRAPDLLPGVVPPAPQDRPVLTVTGAITATNGDDPWAKQRLGFQGVWLRDLVALAHPAPGATGLHLTALDDYQVDLDLADVRADGIFLATRDDRGTPLPVEDGGPTRIVFTDDLVHRFSQDRWIWSLVRIDVR